MSINVYYKGEKLEYDYSEQIGETILKLCLKEGECFDFIPFNYHGDQKTKYKREKKDFHCQLLIVDIKYSLIEDWNNFIKTTIDIYLDKA